MTRCPTCRAPRLTQRGLTVPEVDPIGVEMSACVCPPPSKPCSRCGRELPADAKHFHRSNAASDGLHSWCKVCFNEACRARERVRRQEKAARSRCQAAGCDLPVRGQARGCAIHWPSFERDLPPLSHYACARREWVW